jgi:hypothetical protein
VNPQRIVVLIEQHTPAEDPDYCACCGALRAFGEGPLVSLWLQPAEPSQEWEWIGPICPECLKAGLAGAARRAERYAAVSRYAPLVADRLIDCEAPERFSARALAQARKGGQP